MVRVIAIGGEPATGKTTLMFKLISMADDWKSVKPEKLLDAMYSEKLNLYILGRYVDDGNVFQGTDRLSMAVQPDAEKFFSSLSSESNNVNVIYEGDRLFNAKLLEKLSDWFPEDLKILVLSTSHKTKEKRHRDRNDNQNEKFKTSRETKISNIMSSLVLMGYIDKQVNETLEDQSKIIDIVSQFYNWSEK